MSEQPLDLFADEPATPDTKLMIAQVRDLIVDNQRPEAFRVVCQVLNVDANNVDGLYLYAGLVNDNTKATKALQRLLSIDPQHEKAVAALERLHKQSSQIDPFADQKLKHYEPASIDIPQTNSHDAMMQQMLNQQRQLLEAQQRQPVINITNSASAHAYAAAAVPVETRNETAFLVGLLAGIFLGTLGISYMLNGKLGTGLLIMLAGWFIWGTIAVGLVGLTAGLGACLVLPLHVYLAYVTAKNGAKTVALARAY